MEKIKHFCDILRNQYRCRYLTIHYSGYGDSGAIDSRHVHKKKSFDQEDVLVLQELPPDFEEFFLNKISGDWYNNEGGCGTITIDLKLYTYLIHEGYHETVTEYTDTKGKIE